MLYQGHFMLDLFLWLIFDLKTLFKDLNTVTNPKKLDAQKISIMILKAGFYHEVMPPKDANGMANSVEPDQTAS